MNNKTIIGIIVAAIAAYFLFFRKKKEETKTEEQIIKEAQANTNVKYAQSIEANVEVVEVDKETEEYNNAINEYKRLSNGYAPPKGLTTKQILALCEDMKAKNDVLAEYVKVAGQDDIQDEEMTLEQIQNEIERVKTEKANPVITLINNIGSVTLSSESAIIAARKAYDILSADLKKLVNNYSKLTAAESTLATLKQQKAAAEAKAAQLAQQKASWDQKKAKVNTIVTAFKKTVENNGTALKQVAWDTNTLQAMLNLSQAEKVYANQYFGSTLNGATVRKNYGGTKYKATSIYLAIPDGNTTDWRAGNATAKQVRSVFKSISGSVDQYGVIV